jgi:predicted permease
MMRGLYLALALGALAATQTVFVVALLSGRGLGPLLHDCVATPSATFVTIDLLCVAVAAVAFMIVEGRRVGMRHVWAYVVLTCLVAISVAFPLFLVARERLADRASAGH